jgi:hypothetical protein
MVKKCFSLYDIEEFLREAGAESFNEKTVFSLKKELEELTNEIVSSAQSYANYAGRKSTIKESDVKMVIENGSTGLILKRSHRHHTARKMFTRDSGL